MKIRHGMIISAILSLVFIWMILCSVLLFRVLLHFASSVIRCRLSISEIRMMVSGRSALQMAEQVQHSTQISSEIIYSARENRVQWICFRFSTPEFRTSRLTSLLQVKTETHWRLENH